MVCIRQTKKEREVWSKEKWEEYPATAGSEGGGGTHTYTQRERGSAFISGLLSCWHITARNRDLWVCGGAPPSSYAGPQDWVLDSSALGLHKRVRGSLRVYVHTFTTTQHTCRNQSIGHETLSIVSAVVCAWTVAGYELKTLWRTLAAML